MKKFFISALSVLACAGVANAQSECNFLFPTVKGSVITTKCYDAQDNLLGTTTYQVSDENMGYNSTSSEIMYSVTDRNGQVVNAGKIENTCNNGNVHVRSTSQGANMNNIGQMLSANINLMGSTLDYPDTFSAMPPFGNLFERSEAELTLKSERKGDIARVKLYDRTYEKNDIVSTPAGQFNTTKTSYKVDVYDDNNNKQGTYRNVEWYSLGNGIVRAESYNDDDQLVNYTVLTAMNDN